MQQRSRLVPVGVGLVGAFYGHANVASLLCTKFGKHRAKFGKLQPCHLFIEVLRQNVDLALFIRRLVSKELNLGNDLVGKRRTHDIAGVAGSAAKIHQSTLGEQNDALAVGEDHVINLGLDLVPGAA